MTWCYYFSYNPRAISNNSKKCWIQEFWSTFTVHYLLMMVIRVQLLEGGIKQICKIWHIHNGNNALSFFRQGTVIYEKGKNNITYGRLWADGDLVWHRWSELTFPSGAVVTTQKKTLELWRGYFDLNSHLNSFAMSVFRYANIAVKFI